VALAHIGCVDDAWSRGVAQAASCFGLLEQRGKRLRESVRCQLNIGVQDEMIRSIRPRDGQVVTTPITDIAVARKNLGSPIPATQLASECGAPPRFVRTIVYQ
jgi:hypothetical protein